MTHQTEQQISEEAIEYINKHKDLLIKQFILDKKPLPIDLLTFFMAGSPGAGKTEFAKRYVETSLKNQFKAMKENEELIKRLYGLGMNIQDYDRLFISIDVDAIREFLPQYQKTDVKKGVNGNAHIVQSAANDGIDILREYCFENNISFLHDSTFGNQYSSMKKLIKRSLKLDRDVQIFYIYMDPVIAWKYTQEREYLEGRNVKKENFIHQFFKSIDNVERIKKDFGSDVEVHCILKKKKKDIEKIRFNQPSIANFLKIEYNKGTIKEYNKDELEKIL